jgi:hypothetical protein
MNILNEVFAYSDDISFLGENLSTIKNNTEWVREREETVNIHEIKYMNVSQNQNMPLGYDIHSDNLF